MSIVKFGNSDKDSNGNNIVRRFGKKADRVTYWKWGEPLSFYILDAVKNYLPKYVIQNEFCQALLKSISIQLVRLESEIQQLSNYIFRPKPAVQYANNDLQLYINFGEKTDIVRKAIKDFYLIHKQRGTTLGIINDLRRVTGDNSAYIIYSGYNDCGWWLDYTYPEYNAAGKIAINSNVYYDLQNMLDIVFCNHSGRPTEELIKIIRNEIVPINIETRFIEMQPHVVAWGEPYNFIDPDILQFGVFLFGEIKGGCGFNYNVPPTAETVNYAKLQNTTLSFTFTDNTVVGDPITDPSELTAAIDNFVIPNHRVLATTGAGTTGSVSSGLIYWINCENASSVEINSDTITINFTNGDPLDIVYEDSTQAEYEKEHIDFCFHNANLDRFMQGKTVHKVSPYFVTNVALRQYTTYTEARAEAVSGDVILFEDLTYTVGTERFSLKNGVDIVCKNTRFNVTKGLVWIIPTYPKAGLIGKALFIDDVEVSVNYILGTMTVDIQNNGVSGWLVLNTCRGSTTFIAFNNFFITGQSPPDYSPRSYIHIYGGGRVFVKGNKALDNSRLYDDDPDQTNNFPISCDYDILYASNTIDYIFLPYSEICEWTLRNGYFVGEFENSHNETGGMKFINSKFVCSGFAPALLGTFRYIKLWRSIFLGSTVAFTNNGSGADVTNYNVSYAQGFGADGTETLPNIVEQSTIVVTPPEL